MPVQVCVQDFCEELEYWGLDDLHMEPCCQHTYYRARWLLPQANTDVSYKYRVSIQQLKTPQAEFGCKLEATNTLVPTVTTDMR